jgi:hypothetical protein
MLVMSTLKPWMARERLQRLIEDNRGECKTDYKSEETAI